MKYIEESKGSFVATATSLKVTLNLPQDLEWFKGHFPKQPLLPGVAQLDWVRHYLAQWLGPITLEEVISIKFVFPLRPGNILQLTCTQKAEDKYAFQYDLVTELGLTLASKGIVRICR